MLYLVDHAQWFFMALLTLSGNRAAAIVAQKAVPSKTRREFGGVATAGCATAR